MARACPWTVHWNPLTVAKKRARVLGDCSRGPAYSSEEVDPAVEADDWLNRRKLYRCYNEIPVLIFVLVGAPFYPNETSRFREPSLVLQRFAAPSISRS